MTVAKNTGFMITSSVISILVTIITIPAYLHLVGQERYGVLAIVWSVFLIFGLVELGGGALVRYIASNRENLQLRSDYFLAALAMNLFIGGAIALFVWAGFDRGVELLSFSSIELTEELKSAALIVSVFFLVIAVRSALNGVLVGTERFQAVAVLNFVDSFLSAVVPLAVAYLYSKDIYWLLASVLATRLFLLLIAFLLAHNSLPALRHARLRKACISDLLSFGSWAALASILGAAVSLSDRFVLGSLVSVAQVPFLAVPQNLTQKITIIPRTLGTVLFPRFSQIADKRESRAMAARALAVISAILTPLIIALILGIEVIYLVWISPEFSSGASLVSQVWFIALWFSSMNSIISRYLYGAGQPRTVVVAMLLELLPYAVLLYSLTSELGVAGAALAGLVRFGMDCALLGHFSGLSPAIARQMAITVPMFVAAMLISNLLPLDSVLRWSLSVVLACIVCAHTVLYMPADLVKLFRRLPLVGQFPLGIWASTAREAELRHAD